MRLFLLVPVLLCTTRTYADHIQDQIAQIVHLLNNLSATINHTCTCSPTPPNYIQSQGNDNKALHNEFGQNERASSSESTVSGYPSQMSAFLDANSWINSIIMEANKGAPETTTSKSTKFTIKRLQSKDPPSCTTTAGEEGKCVKPQNCTVQLPDTEDSPPFNYREGSCACRLQCCPLDKIQRAPQMTKPLHNECGWTKTVDNFGELPWTVTIHNKAAARTDGDYKLISVGTLIHPRAVLADGDTLLDLQSKEVICRVERSTSEGHYHYDRNVEKIESTIYYYFGVIKGYVAVLFLESPFVLSDTPAIGVACLARTVPPDGTSCTALGRDEHLRPCPFTIQIPLESLDTKECKQMKPFPPCFEYVQKGSPLICPLQTDGSGTRYVVYGLSESTKYCSVSAKDFYESHLMYNFVDRVMEAAGLNQTTYTV